MREVLRVGRERVEHWVQRSQGLMLIGHQDMDLSGEHRSDALAKPGYALAPSVGDTLAKAAAAAGLRWASLQPAFAWGWQRLKVHHRWRVGGSWWVWMEQDRALVVRVQRGRVCTMNSSAVLPRSELQLQRLIEA